jgi:hypothetical protein
MEKVGNEICVVGEKSGSTQTISSWEFVLETPSWGHGKFVLNLKSIQAVLRKKINAEKHISTPYNHSSKAPSTGKDFSLASIS